MGPFLGQIIWLYEIVLIIRIVLTWIPHNPYNQAVQFLYRITEPVLRPIRRYIPTFSGIDFSPIIVFIGLGILRSVVISMF